jgi:CheY-like chemotaxis protein
LGDPAASEAVPVTFEPTDDRGNLGKDPFVLIVEDDPAFAAILLDLAHEAGLKGVISPTGSGTTALARKLQPAAITLDLGLSDMDGFVLLDLLRHEDDTASIPVYVISGGDMADDALELGAVEVIEKPADRERLAKAFNGIARLKPRKKPAKGAAKKASASARQLVGRKILLVDDDIRNIYSLTSVLEAQGAEILHAERGAEGIELLKAHPDVDAALIDIMMPEMDGYETMRQIRSQKEIAGIPLVAVTAKAMMGDRQKCLEAGATDYIAKPVDIDMLLALLRVTIERGAIERDDKSPSSKAAA